MKKIIYLLSILLLFGCKKDDPNPNPTTPTTAIAGQCKINGITRNFNLVDAIYLEGTLTLTMSDTLTDTIPSSVNLSLQNVGVKTYDLEVITNDSLGFLNVPTTSILYSDLPLSYTSYKCNNSDNNGGQITITKFDEVNRLVSGSFHSRVGDYIMVNDTFYISNQDSLEYEISDASFTDVEYR